LSKEILKLYRFLCECSNDEVLITPRELQMMALLTLSHSERFPGDNPIAIARHYAYLLSKELVPAQNRDEFEKQFKYHLPLASVPVLALSESSDFVLTPSRQGLYQQLNDLTALRDYRRHTKDLSEEQ